MKTRKMWIGLWVGLVCLALWVSPVWAGKSAQAERYDVNLDLQADGSLRVSETLVFRYSGGPFTYVKREIPADKTDGLRFVEAGMDGKKLPQGTSAGQVEVSGGDPLSITWHFEGVSDSTHTFTLTYLASGVVEKQAEADVLAYRALPVDHDYPIAASTVRVTYPAAAKLQGQPTLLSGQAVIQSEAGAVIFQGGPLSADQTLEVRLAFAPGGLSGPAPAWQTWRQAQAERDGGMLWVFGGLSLAFLGVGGIGIGAFARRYRPLEASMPVSSVPGPVPPSDLAPAIVSALLNGGEPQASSRMATLFDLAQRGVLEISEQPKRGWFAQPDFEVRLRGTAGLKADEYSLLQALFETEMLVSGLTASLREGSERTARAWDGPAHALTDELLQSGWVDAERRQAKKRWLPFSLGALALAVAGLVVCTGQIERWGGWAMLLGATLTLLALAWVIVVVCISTLTPKGQTEAARWKAYREYLSGVFQEHESAVHLDLLEAALAYAAALGMAQAWMKFFKKQGLGTLPAWFQVADPVQGSSSLDGFYGLIDSYSATASGADGSAGGGDGGSAGGGSSSTG